MAEIIRNRTIRPSSRGGNSKSYKIDTKSVLKDDTLTVSINHENSDFTASYKFSGQDVCQKNSIHFSVSEINGQIIISWSGAKPIDNQLSNAKSFLSPNKKSKDSQKDLNIKKTDDDGKMLGLAPLVDKYCKILVLGTMPGVDSLKKQEYYGNSRNLFWELISNVVDEPIPEDYELRKQWLLSGHIGLWDVCLSCVRMGSLDSDILDEIPNDLAAFVKEYPNIEVIAFNGQAAAKLFGKHIGSLPSIKLMVLPSSSPANAGISPKIKNIEWSKLKTKL